MIQTTRNFNPRTCERCDISQFDLIYSTFFISIHAPVKGATYFYLPFNNSFPYFNPRTCERCDSRRVNVGVLEFQNFNPRTCERCDPLSLLTRSSHAHFNPRTCERCDDIADAISKDSELFQSTHLWKVRLNLLFSSEGILLFQSTHLWKVRRDYPIMIILFWIFQSTHLWKVRLFWLLKLFTNFFISIHAPVKGATPQLIHSTIFDIISIHAPVKGATELFWPTNWSCYISIHAPVKGATNKARGLESGTRNFNPRTCERCDSIIYSLSCLE